MTPAATDIAIPVLASLDFDESIAFYEALGFETAGRFPDYAIVRHGGMEVHFWACEDRAICEATSCYLRVADVDTLHRAWTVAAPDAGGRINGVEDKPWGLREFAVWDPHGNLLRVGQIL